MNTVTNPGSAERHLSIEQYRAKLAASWAKLGKHAKPDHLHLACRQLATDALCGDFDPLPMQQRIFDLRFERYI